MAVKDPLIDQQFDGYRIVDLIGRGGMGSVYRARDESRQRDVALKVLQFEAREDPRAAERFRREARLAAQLDHPNIVSVRGSGSAEGYLYLVMELVEGRSLRAELRHRRGALPIDQALSVAGQVFAALQAAHQHGIIHRDIKPENILLSEDRTVKVLDFGVARMEGGTVLTRADEILGTVEYMAPEQILGDGVGPAVDLYATGVVLYEMLTGGLPFSGDSPVSLVYHQLNEEPHAPSFLNPSVPRALDRFVLRLLDKLPENRYASPGEALAALEQVQQRQQLIGIPRFEIAEEAEEEEDFRARDFRPRFTGRQAEFGALLAHFDVLSEGGRVVFVSGEAGIGKTRMVEEVGRQVEERGGRVIRGVCFFEHGMGPYMPFLDAIGNLFSKTEHGLTDTERQGLAALLRQEAPGLVELAASSSTTAKVRASFAAALGAQADPEAARQCLFDGVFALLSAAATTRPLVVFLEDLHWADEGSLQLLQYLVRRAAEARVLWIVTYRPEELAREEAQGISLAQLLQQLQAKELLHEVRLQRLEQDALERLVRSLFPESDFAPDFGEFIYAQSQGNPFIALEVLKLLRSHEVLYCDSGIWTVRADLAEVEVPDRINALIVRRADQLDADHRELLQLAAVIGSRFTSKVLEAASGLSRLGLLKALFRLEKKSQLIASIEGGYEFCHPKIREVLYAEIPGELRREYHQVLANVLEQLQAQGQEVGAEELSNHLYRAEEFARAVPHLIRSGDEAFALFGWRRAVTLFDQAAEASRRSHAATALLLHALRRSGMAYIYLTAHDKALDRLAQMRELAHQEGRPEDEAEAWKLIGKVHEQLRRFPDAVAACEKALSCLEGRDAPLIRERILISWGCIDFECGRYAAAESRWREVLVLAGG
ncbi:MAG: protein kinase, partial [Candidatus Latescibacterota bacterium]